MTQIEMIATLTNCINEGIKSGDWKVDGACDPTYYLDMAEAMLEQEGYEKNHAVDDDWALSA